MAMARKVRMLLAARGISITQCAERMTPKTTVQNLSAKLRRDNLHENDLKQIAEVCDATFVGKFVLNDTKEEV